MENYKVMGIEVELTAGKANEIEGVFSPFHSKIIELNKEFEQLEKVELTPEVAKKAGLLRKKYVPLRTGSEKARKAYKGDVLKLSKAIDSIGNLVKDMASEKESVLKEKENYLEVLEAKRLEKLKTERLVALEEYNIDGSAFGVENMDQAVWDSFLAGQKSNHEAEKQRKKEEFLAKLKKDKEDILHKERTELLIPVWGFLSSEYKSLNFGTVEEIEFSEILARCINCDIDFKKEQEKIRQENEALRAEQKKKDEQRRIEKAKQDKIIAKEREDRQELERKMREKQEAERKAREENEAAELAAKQAPDKEKLLNWLNSFDLQIPNFEDENFSSIASKLSTTIYFHIKGIKDRL